jgi:hypothetical protein
VANRDAIRLLSFGLLVALSASRFSAQDASAAVDDPKEVASAAQIPKAKAIAEMPPNQPKVTCKGDQLTISAENATLGSVLAAVHTCLGVQIDVPDGATASRVFDQLGPGPVRQVLTTFLSGTDFDYMIGSSVSDPQKVETVLLTLRASGSPNGALVGGAVGDRPLTPARRAWMQGRQNGRTGTPPGEDASPAAVDSQNAPVADDSAVTPAESPAGNGTQTAPTTPVASNTPATPTPAVDASTAAPALADNAAAPPSDASRNSAQDKGIEDKITNMQQLFEQRRQMTENQSASPK